jgi:hypothetical protein
MLKIFGADITYLIPTEQKLDRHEDMGMHFDCDITI